MHSILIVDDEPSICFAMSDYFDTMGYEVDCANDLRDAADRIALHGCYSVAIVDLRLAGSSNMDGLELVKLLKEKCPQTRVLVLTAYGAPEVEREAKQRGANAFLHKPKPLPEVAQIVYGLLGARVA